jgi:hypothetical protein
MRKLRIGIGPLLALGVLMMGSGVGIAAYVAQLEPESPLQTALPLARI